MEVLTSNYKINTIVDSRKTTLDTDRTVLWIWHADKIPPHIGISTKKKYFSLKSSGKDTSLPVETIIQLIERKEIKTLAVELDINLSFISLEKVFGNYFCTKANEITCLTPIKSVLNRLEPTKLEYLLEELEVSEDIRRYIGFNIDDSFQGIPNYSIEDIHARLELLERGN